MTNAVDWTVPGIPGYVAPEQQDPKPHKCPVCDGQGRTFCQTASTGTLGDTCNGCNGSGIVWSP